MKNPNLKRVYFTWCDDCKAFYVSFEEHQTCKHCKSRNIRIEIDYKEY